ncbi:MAG TPA: hypothetical protein VFT08_07700 [Pyrinomonadaceae bacterium]|nr:hypothetical protein [Pyrinomonadaceae bacterium]
MIGRLAQCVIVVAAVILFASCVREEGVKKATLSQPQSANVASSPDRSRVTWSSSDLETWLDNYKELKRAWVRFQRSQPYRLAQPSDRNLTAAAASRVETNSERQIVPYLMWWGAEGYEGREFLAAIVVDPSRTDPNRYGLVVIAAPTSDGSKYKPYWVAREEDMESYLLSPASGSLFIECFRRDGTEETKELAWYRSKRQFQLKPPYSTVTPSK